MTKLVVKSNHTKIKALEIHRELLIQDGIIEGIRHINPYGLFPLNLSKRLKIKVPIAKEEDEKLEVEEITEN